MQKYPDMPDKPGERGFLKSALHLYFEPVIEMRRFSKKSVTHFSIMLINLLVILLLSLVVMFL